MRKLKNVVLKVDGEVLGVFIRLKDSYFYTGKNAYGLVFPHNRNVFYPKELREHILYPTIKDQKGRLLIFEEQPSYKDLEKEKQKLLDKIKELDAQMEYVKTTIIIAATNQKY